MPKEESDRKPDVTAAYGLKTPEDSVRLYRDWAATYDSGFIAAQEYRLPEVVALAYAGRGGGGPVLDVGAGTGVLGEHLKRMGIGPVEAMDISPEMIEVARGKEAYSAYYVADLTRGLDFESGYYAGVVSSGTFTLGHVGPEALDELIRVTAHGGLICLSVNAEHYAAAGFAAKFDALGETIRDLRADESRIYGDGADADHRDATAMIVSFHRA